MSKNALDKGPTTKPIEKQMEENIALMKKGFDHQYRTTVDALQNRITTLEATQRKAAIPPSFLVKPLAKSFDDHLAEDYPGIPAKRALEMHYDLAQSSLGNASFKGEQPAVGQMQKSMGDFAAFQGTKSTFAGKYSELQKAFGGEEYENLAKSFLGGAGAPGAPGAWFSFLEENLSRYIQRIILENADTTALQSIATSITSNIIPELGRLKSSGVGYGKHTMGLSKEGGTFQFGGGQLMDRLTNNLVQRGIKASVTELLLGNKQKLIDRNPLELERELRVLEFNLGMNHNLLYGNDQIHKTGSTINEVSGFEQQLTDPTTGHPAHIMDWDGKALNATTENPLNIFRRVAEDLVVNGHIPGGAITGRYTTLIDYGVSNNISTVVDEKQRLLIQNYADAAIQYGQQFSGFVTDLGTFRFKRSKTLDLTAGDTWTLDDDVPPTAIISTLAGATLKAVPTGVSDEKEDAGFPDKLDLPTGKYLYRVSVVNDQAESNISAAIETTTDGSTPADVAATQTVVITIPYETEFAGGVVAGETVTPARYFLIYRSNAEEGATPAEMSCIAKVPINGTSATTYVDWNQRIPGTAPMFFIPNDPMDLAHCSLTPTYEVPFYDPLLGTTRQWQIMNIGGLCMWAPVRCYLVNNVPRFPK